MPACPRGCSSAERACLCLTPEADCRQLEFRKRHPKPGLELQVRLDDDSRMRHRMSRSCAGTAMARHSCLPESRSSQAVVHLHNVSGGILSGDSLHLSIEAGTSTRVQVTSVGATRIYRQRRGTATPPVHFHSRRRRRDVGISARYRHSVLWLALQPVHRCLARPECRVHRMGNDCGRPDRERRGVRIRFSFIPNSAFAPTLARWRSSATRLTPSDRDPRSVARWGRFRYSATLYICHTGVAQSAMDRTRIPPERYCVRQTCQCRRAGA